MTEFSDIISKFFKIFFIELVGFFKTFPMHLMGSSKLSTQIMCSTMIMEWKKKERKTVKGQDRLNKNIGSIAIKRGFIGNFAVFYKVGH